MSLKTQEKVLKFLNDYFATNERNYNNGFNELLHDLPNISNTELLKTLLALKDKGLINFNQAKDGIYHIRLTPKGMNYFEDKAELNKEKWSNRRWNIFMLIFGYILGLLTTTAKFWIESYLR